MADLKRLSTVRPPIALELSLAAIAAIGVTVVLVCVISLIRGPILCKSAELGTQGDFFGGHIAAAAGMLTLAIVIYTAYCQSLQQERYFLRQYFLQGVDLIASAIRENDSIAALRLTEYYSRLVLSTEDTELFLILNTVFSGDIRKQLENPDSNTRGNYPFAVDAICKIGMILKTSALERKGLPKDRLSELPGEKRG
jgi:hypothetical protein